MSRFFALTLLLLLAGLPALCQKPKTDPTKGWVFAVAKTETELTPLADPQEPGANLSWAICGRPLKATKVHPLGAGRYQTEEGVTRGENCLLVDSVSYEKMFIWGVDEERITKRTACIDGFSKQAEDLENRKTSSCDWLGGPGTGEIELVTYTSSSSEDGLAALLMDNQHSPDPEDHQRWSVLFPAGSLGWSEGVFHAEQFHHLFTVERDDVKPERDIQFVAIEWDGPKGTELILYQPHGKTLKTALVNHNAAPRDLTAEK